MNKLKATFITIILFTLFFSCTEKVDETKQVDIVVSSPQQKNSGGVIDGGGSGYEYPTVKEVSSTLDYMIGLIEEDNPARNISIVIQNISGKYDYDDSPIELYPENNVSDILLELVGSPTQYLFDQIDECSKSMDNKACLKQFPLYRKGLGRIVNKSNIDLKDKCYDQVGRERIGSVDSFSLNARICVSRSELLKIPKVNLKKNILALLFHEAAHMIGLTTEKEAEEVEYYILKHAESALYKIENSEEYIKAGKENIMRVLYTASKELEEVSLAKKASQGINIDTSNWNDFNFIAVNEIFKNTHEEILARGLRNTVSYYYNLETERKYKELTKKLRAKLRTTYEVRFSEISDYVISSDTDRWYLFTNIEAKYINSTASAMYEDGLSSLVIDKYEAMTEETIAIINEMISTLDSSSSPNTDTEVEDFITELLEDN